MKEFYNKWHKIILLCVAFFFLYNFIQSCNRGLVIAKQDKNIVILNQKILVLRDSVRQGLNDIKFEQERVRGSELRATKIEEISKRAINTTIKLEK
jgi:hypothetical protein